MSDRGNGRAPPGGGRYLDPLKIRSTFDQETCFSSRTPFSTKETKQPGAADKSAHVQSHKCPAAWARSRLTRGAEDIWAAGWLGARLIENICDSRRTSIFTEKLSNLAPRINRRMFDQIIAQRLGGARVVPGGGRYLAR